MEEMTEIKNERQQISLEASFMTLGETDRNELLGENLLNKEESAQNQRDWPNEINNQIQIIENPRKLDQANKVKQKDIVQGNGGKPQYFPVVSIVEEQKVQEKNLEDEEEDGDLPEQHPLMTFQRIRQIIYEIYSADGSANDPLKENEYRKMFSYGRETQLTWKNQLIENPKQSDYLRVAAITWNLKGSCPIKQLEAMIQFFKQSKHHIVAIAAQECERSIAASFFYSSKSKWEHGVINCFGSEYVKAGSVKMNAIHLIVMYHVTLQGMVGNIQTDSKPTGLYNKIGNKGGVAISMDVNGKSYVFANVHLSSGREKKEKRNQDLQQIESSLHLGKSNINNKADSIKMSDRFDYAFLMGDLNYRINVDILQKDLEKHDYIQLLLHDQLLQEIELMGLSFSEGMISFPPSYKLQIHSNRFYSGKKKRQPAWTDRVLFKSAKSKSLFLISYDCCTNVFGSDHRPVYAQFLVKNNPNQIL